MDRFWASQINQMIHCRAHSSARMQYVIKQDDRLVIDIERNPGVINLAVRQQSVEIIAVQSDVHFPKGYFFAIEFLDYLA